MAHSERIHTGVLYGCSESAHRRVFLVNETSEDSCESEVEYPLTPPLSESSGSRSHSPDHATFPADLNIITMMHLSRLRKRRNVAVRRQPKSMFYPVHLLVVGYLIGAGKGVSSVSSKLTLHIVSRASGKPAIVSASRSLLQSYVSGASMPDTMPSRIPYNLTVSKLAMVLEGQIRQSLPFIKCSEL